MKAVRVEYSSDGGLDKKIKEYADLNMWIHKLKTVIDERKIMKWLCTSNAAFNNRKPLDMIMAGESEELNRMIYEIGEGVFQ
jgi:hypothetical protein